MSTSAQEVAVICQQGFAHHPEILWKNHGNGAVQHKGQIRGSTTSQPSSFAPPMLGSVAFRYPASSLLDLSSPAAYPQNAGAPVRCPSPGQFAVVGRILPCTFAAAFVGIPCGITRRFARSHPRCPHLYDGAAPRCTGSLCLLDRLDLRLSIRSRRRPLAPSRVPHLHADANCEHICSLLAEYIPGAHF